jgi:Tfp pilus assembly protein PilP
MTNQRKWFILGGLFLAWGGLTFFQMSDSAPTDPLSHSAISGTLLPPVKDLELDNTFPNSRQIAKFSTPRNIFAPLGMRHMLAQQETKPVHTSHPSETIQSVPPPPPSGPSPAELAGLRAREQLNQFRFLGYLTKGGESQAFLTNGQAIYIVKQGEMLEGRVQVNKIEPETVILSTQVWETGNHVQATIPLTPDTRG